MASAKSLTRREADRALVNLDHILLHLASIKDKLSDGQHDEYVDMCDKLGESFTYHKLLLEQLRNVL